jgi:hypothetical protein
MDNICASMGRMAVRTGCGEMNGVGPFVEIDVFEHDNVVCPGGHWSTGHDFYGLSLRKFHPGYLDGIAGANLANDGNWLARLQVGGVAGVTVPGRAIKRGLVAIGKDGPAQYAA